MQKSTLTALRAGAAPLALAVALSGTPALAQNTPAVPVTTVAADDEADDDNVILVTGSILSRTDTETPSPVSVLDMDELETRGVNTVAEGLQRLSANGSGTISEGWNNGNNFAAGANAVSLRGLTVQKTLTVFNGLRMAPYPLADDGHRNFVDLNTIPDVIVERVEVLKDGASSTYGADAVAGVVNIITKREIQGLHLNASVGVSQEGDGGEQRVDASYGVGDIGSDGFNIYVAGTYRKNDVIWARDRDYPWNSGDLSNICNDAGSCMAIPTRWYEMGVNANGTLGGSTIPDFPVVSPGTAAGVRTGTYQLLNNNCGAFGAINQTLPDSARQFGAANTALAGVPTWATAMCQKDTKQAYATLRPSTERYGFAARATAAIGEDAEAYLSGNYMHVNTYSQLTPSALGTTTTPPPSSVAWNAIVLPVYVCPGGTATFAGNVNVSSCTAGSAGATLNPNNPFAASGQNAILRGRYDRPQTVETNARSLRAEAGIRGSFGGMDEWNYDVSFTASEVKLDRISENYIIPQRVADLIANGQYNFVQPWLNTQATRDYVSPVNVKTSVSSLWQAQAIISRDLFELPGGALQAAAGVAYRHESIDDASANPENLAHPYDRYFTINAVGAIGSRNVASGFFEIGAPIIDQLEVNLSGRYDDYSSGQTNFSPKVGVKVKPIEQVVLRGTWSEGFRIPSFNEAFGLPTTGYTTLSNNCGTDAAPGPRAAFCRAHSPNGTIASANAYATGQYPLGRTSTGNPALQPEKSTSWTIGTVIEPMRNLSFTVDYFNIKVDDVIANISAADQDAALNAFFANGTTNAVPGVIVVPAQADPQFPTAQPLPQFIQFSFQNADTERVEGVDFAVDFDHDFGSVGFATHLEASYLIKYEVERADGSVERYDGSLSPCDYTSCSGSPSWRATWSNTLTFGDLNVTGTAYYTDGYDLASIDYGGVKGDCDASIGASVVTYQDGSPVKCTVGAQWNVDLAANYEINEQFTVYANVLNVLGIDPKFDPSAAYSIFQYNPAWGQANIVGRYFRIGAKVDF
jgi:iron complex outermembrane receptor protein